uniref:Uncharacterized protein n=1 Tax=Glossina palpalis gambiensis TaxID=67801 RepID=A0A1B0BW68_9MUSC
MDIIGNINGLPDREYLNDALREMNRNNNWPGGDLPSGENKNSDLTPPTSDCAAPLAPHEIKVPAFFCPLSYLSLVRVTPLQLGPLVSFAEYRFWVGWGATPQPNGWRDAEEIVIVVVWNDSPQANGFLVGPRFHCLLGRGHAGWFFDRHCPHRSRLGGGCDDDDVIRVVDGFFGADPGFSLHGGELQQHRCYFYSGLLRLSSRTPSFGEREGVPASPALPEVSLEILEREHPAVNLVILPWHGLKDISPIFASTVMLRLLSCDAPSTIRMVWLLVSEFIMWGIKPMKSSRMMLLVAPVSTTPVVARPPMKRCVDNSVNQ